MALRSTVRPNGQDLPRGQDQTCIKKREDNNNENMSYDEDIFLSSSSDDDGEKD